MEKTQISVVIPLFNEAESLPELHDWIVRVMKNHNFSYEILFVDDGSTDDSWKVISMLSEKNSCVRGFKFVRNYGKTAALQTAFNHTVGNVVITMDADLQDSPDEIPELYRMIVEDGYDIVSGWKQKRHDPLSKTIPTKFFNGLARWFSGIKLHDFNCGLKSYNSRVIKNITIYGEMHRYIPVVAKWNGFKKIGEKVVQHQARKYGYSKFGIERAIGILDILSITFVNKFGRRPMHLFGSLGVLSFFIGFVITLWLAFDKVYSIYAHTSYRNLTDDPKFFLALIAMVIGSQLFLAGFLGELFVKGTIKRDEYLVSERVG
ncbi:MAG: glycosyltransferase [Spirosomaceae bacterium]|jgi:glycosyltransferase involved in cell wall biosynthesis|nr:glycosyltransferase [Spirosomataceae bacterium]